MKLYKIFIPKRYNSGDQIPSPKVHRITESIREKFGAYSLNPFARLPVIQGVWTNDKSQMYKEPMYVIELFIEDTFDNKRWLSAFKELVRQELGQKELFIIVQDAEILM